MDSIAPVFNVSAAVLRWLKIVAVAVAIPLAGSSLSPVYAQEATVPEAPPVVKVSERPDSMAASLTARSQGSAVEDVSQRTATSRVMAEPDGTWTLESFGEPVFTRDAAGRWVDIDESLSLTADGVVPAAVPVDVEFSRADRAADGVAELAGLKGVDAKGRRVSLGLGWKGALPDPVIRDEAATYRGAAAGVAGSPDADVVVSANRKGFSHSVVLGSKPAGAVVLRFPLSLSAGLKASVDAETGAVFVRDTAGGTVFYAPAPMMWDSRIDAVSSLNARVRPVKTALVTSGGVTELVLTADADFLAAEDTVYPVTIDPTWVQSASASTWMQYPDYTSSQVSSTELRVGSWDAGAHKARSYLRFDTAALTGKKILSSYVQLNNFYSASCTATKTWVFRVTEAWSPTGITWGTQPAVTTTDPGSLTDAAGYSSACPAENVLFPVTAMTQHWADKPAENFGVRLIAATESDSLSWRKYRSPLAYTGSHTNEPHLRVNYNSYPNTAWSGQFGTGQSTVWTDPATGAKTTFVKTVRPSVSAIVSDPDGGNVRGEFTVSNSGSTPWDRQRGFTVSSGGRSVFTPPTTAPALTDGGSYWLSAWSSDGSLSSKTEYKKIGFVVDATAPAAPSVTASALTNGQWTDPMPASNRFTFSSSSADTVRFLYSRDGGAWTEVKNAASPTTATLDWVAEGAHSLKVKAVDKAANASAATEFTFGAGGASMTGPSTGAASTDIVNVTASAPGSSAGTVTPTVYWRAAGTAEPADFDAVSGSVTGWTAAETLAPAPAGSPVTVKYPFSAAAAAAQLGRDRTPALLDVQVCFAYASGGLTKCTRTAATVSKVSVLRLPHAFGNGYPTAGAGPGQVALWTGEFNTTETDVDAAGLSVSRSYSSLAGVDTGSVFGPGWTASFPVAAGAAGLEVVDNTRVDGTIVLVDGQGAALAYRQPGGTKIQMKEGVYTPVNEDAVTAGARLELTGTGTAARIRFTDIDGTVTVFSPDAYTAGTDTGWGPLSVTEPAAAGTTSYTRDGQGRVTRILSPAPEGVSCPAGTAELAKGCRALTIGYAGTTTATTAAPGDYAGRVTAVTLHAWNPQKAGGEGMDALTVAAYKYDTAGRLVEATDPRSNRSDTYTYGAASASGVPLLTGVKPAGLAGYTLSYGASAQSGSSLLAVSRAHADGTAGSVQLARYVYKVPVTGTAGLPDLGADAVALWSQAAAPVYGAAVFSADKPVGTSDPAGITEGDWQYADLQYTDGEGYTVNTAGYGAGAWQLTATDYSDGRVIRSIDQAGMANIRQAAASQGLTAGRSLGDADSYATITRYNTDIAAAADITLSDGTVIKAGTILTPAGSLVTDTWSPAKPTGTDGTRLRVHTRTAYDQGAPGTVNPATGLPWNLPTTVTVTTADPNTGSSDAAVPVATGEPVLAVTTTGYDPIDGAPVTGPTSGWILGAGTSTTVDAGAGAGITTKTRYDAVGRTVETRQPASTGTDAGTRLSVYYTAAANASYPECGGQPAWADLECRIGTGEAVSTKPVTLTAAYTMLLDPAKVTETRGTAVRTTTTTYTPDGAEDTVTVTVAGVADSAKVPVSKNVYDPGTGLQTATVSLDAAGTETGRTATGYDKWARTVSYTDATGAQTTSAYNDAGQLAAVTTPQGVNTYAYDGTDAAGNTERRGLPTGLTVTNRDGSRTNGQFSAAYDAAGQLVRQVMPAGIVQERSYDEAGQPAGLAYHGQVTTETGAETGPWLAWAQARDALGRVSAETTPEGVAFESTAAGYARAFTYDGAARLTRVEDRTAAAGTVVNTDPAQGQLTPCTTRTYTFDVNGNRTGTSSAVSGSDGACTITGATTKSWSYDAGDRVQAGANASGNYTYDLLGRQTLIPGIDTPAGAGAGNLALGYYDTDAAHKLTQNGVTTTYTLDPEGRRQNSTDGTGTVARHYADGTDNPAWAEETTGTVTTITRYEASIGGDLGLTVTGNEAKLAVANPHGDTVSTITVPATGNAAGIDSWSGYDEYGNKTTAALPGTGALTYGWLGTKERETADHGLILMGARLYNTVTGLFTSVDPVHGGNTTDYTYPQDPINKTDTTGKWWNWGTFWDVASIGLMFVPGIGAIAWGYRIYRVVRAANQYMRGVAGANNYIKASRPTAAVAGRIWTRSWSRNASTGRAKNGAHMITNNSTTRAYRSARRKGAHGWSSNLTTGVSGVSRNGQSTYRSFHVNHRSRWW